MNAAAENAPPDVARLFAEIAELKRQRNDCLAQLAECRRQLAEYQRGDA